MATTRTPARFLLRDRARRFVELATTPLVPGDFWEVLDPLRGGANPRGRIVAVRRETRDATSIAIRPGRGWRGHTAGQCHTSGMRDPAQTQDAGRNATMNSNAAR